LRNTSHGLHIVRKRRPDGDRWYVYARRGGPLIHTQDGCRPVITDTLLAKAQAALGHIPRDRLDAVLDAYRASPEFTRLGASTQREYRHRLDAISHRFGKVPLRLVPQLRAEIIAWRDELAATPRAADRSVGMLATALKWALDREMVSANPAAGIGKLHRTNRADLIWEDRHWRAINQAKVPGHVRRVLDLGSLTGLRIGDLLRLSWQDVGDAFIALPTEKSRGQAEAIIPLHGDLARFLTGPGQGAILRTSHGKPWTKDGWHSSWQAARPEGFDRKVHDLRGTFATRLMASGYTDTEIAMVMGWSAERIAAIRLRYVDRSRVARALAERLNRRESVNPL
jgi:integrase